MECPIHKKDKKNTLGEQLTVATTPFTIHNLKLCQTQKQLKKR